MKPLLNRLIICNPKIWDLQYSKQQNVLSTWHKWNSQVTSCDRLQLKCKFMTSYKITTHLSNIKYRWNMTTSQVQTNATLTHVCPHTFQMRLLSWTPGAGPLLVFQSPLETLLLGDPMLPLLAIFLDANPLVSWQSEETAVPSRVWESYPSDLFPIGPIPLLLVPCPSSKGPLTLIRRLCLKKSCVLIYNSLYRERGQYGIPSASDVHPPSPTSENLMSVSSVHSTVLRLGSKQTGP